MNIALFLENLDYLRSADFERISAEARSAAKSPERSACLALCAIGMGDTEAALSWIEDALQFNCPTDFVSFASATVYMQTGRVASAIEPLQGIGEQFLKYHDARVLLATAHLYAGQLAEAESVALGVDFQGDDMRASLLGLRARCAQARSDELAAQSLYREALTYGPQLEWVQEALKSQPKVIGDSLKSNIEVVKI